MNRAVMLAVALTGCAERVDVSDGDFSKLSPTLAPGTVIELGEMTRWFWFIYGGVGDADNRIRYIVNGTDDFVRLEYTVRNIEDNEETDFVEEGSEGSVQFEHSNTTFPDIETVFTEEGGDIRLGVGDGQNRIWMDFLTTEMVIGEPVGDDGRVTFEQVKTCEAWDVPCLKMVFSEGDMAGSILLSPTKGPAEFTFDVFDSRSWFQDPDSTH